MGPDDATDVAKALAAFGAPSIRYHSFGQSQVKPSSVVLPRLGLAPLEAAANPAPAPLPAIPANLMLSMLPIAPRSAGPVLDPATTSPMVVPLTSPSLTVTLPDVLPLDVAPLDVPIPVFRRTPDPAASPRSIPSHAVARHDPANEPSPAIAMTLRAALESDETVGKGLPYSVGQTLPTAFAVTRLSARPPIARPPTAPLPSAPPISIKVNAMSKLGVLPLLGRSAPAEQPGQSLAAIFAFLASDPMPDENSSLL